MNHGDFNRDPVESDEFLGELADTMDLVDEMTHDRLSGGESDRRREAIMDRVRGRKVTGRAADDVVEAAAPAPRPGMGTFDTGRRITLGDAQIGAGDTEWDSVACAALGGHAAVDTFATSRLLRAAARAAAQADAERYRDSALQKAAAIVKKAEQDADALRAEAQRVLDEARQEASPITAAAGSSADLSNAASARQDLRPLPSPVRACDEVRPADAAQPYRAYHAVLKRTLTRSTDGDHAPVVLWSSVTGGRWRAAAELLQLDDIYDVLHPADPSMIVECTSALRSDAAWNLSRAASEQPDLSERLDRLMVLLYPHHGPDRDRVCNVFREQRNAWTDECELSRRLLLHWQWSSQATALSADVALRCRTPGLSAVLPMTDSPRGDCTSGIVPVLSSVPRLLLACDVEGASRVDTGLRSYWQHMVGQIISQAAVEAGLDSHYWTRDARGDGELAILPAGTPRHTVFGQLLHALDRRLREHNGALAGDARLRLRVAVHEGVVASGVDHSFTGQAATTVSRLVEAPPLLRALSDFPDASMAVAVSDPVYRDVEHDRRKAWDERYVRLTVPPVAGSSDAAWVFVPERGTASRAGSWRQRQRMPPSIAAGEGCARPGSSAARPGSSSGMSGGGGFGWWGQSVIDL